MPSPGKGEGRGKTDLAVRDFSTVIDLDPENPANYLTRGLALSQSGAPQRAVADFRTGCGLGDASACAFLAELK